MSPALALLLAAGLQAAPVQAPSEATVLLTRRIDLPRLTASEIVQAVAGAVEAERIGTLSPAAAADRLKAGRLGEPDACSGKKDCVLALGRKLGVSVVVGVQVGSVPSSSAPVAVHLEALKVADGTVLAELDAEVQRDKLQAISGLGEFARRLREALTPQPVATVTPPKPPEAKPVEAKPAPEVKPPPPDARPVPDVDKPHEIVAVAPPPPPLEGVPPEALGTTKEAAPKGHTAGYAMIGVAAASGAAAIGCLAAGMVLKKGVEGTQIDMTRAQAERRVKTVNALMTTSLIAGIVAAGAGVTVAFVW